MGVHDNFWPGVLAGISAPNSPWNQTTLEFWARQEGNENYRFWINNPLASTQAGNLDTSFNIGLGPGIWNSVGVKVYADAQSGINAMVTTLLNGYYPNILRCLRDQTAYPEVVRDFNIWINGPNAGSNASSYGPAVLAFMQTNLASKSAVVPTMTLEDRMDFLEHLTVGYKTIAADGTELSNQAALDYAREHQLCLMLAIENLQQGLAALSTTVAHLSSGASEQDIAIAIRSIFDTYLKGVQAK